MGVIPLKLGIYYIGPGLILPHLCGTESSYGSTAQGIKN